MSRFSCLGLVLFALPCLAVAACAGPAETGTGGAAGVAGSGGSTDGGVGGMGGAGAVGGGGDAGLSCNITGCDDGNECTVDGVCNTLMGVCIGGGVDEDVDTPCVQGGGFFCDGEGSCVVCNDASQCARFFPPNECREPAQCVDNECPFPEALPDGTPCSDGECFQGLCTDVAPRTKLVPMVCDNQSTPFFWSVPMDMTVAPTAIEATRPFLANISPTLSIPQEFLQFGLIAVFPEELTAIEVTSAAAEIVTEGVLEGSPVSTILTSAPLVEPIPQVPNPGDPGGSACTENADCPLAEFGQRCGSSDQCECACQQGCMPASCANLAIGDIEVRLNPIFATPYRAGVSGDVCFDVGGADPPSAVGAPLLRTGIRAVASNGALVRFECVGGTVNDNGTPDFPFDDFVDPNTPDDQVCFPIEQPEVNLCDGPSPIDCSSENQCITDAVCDPFIGECAGGTDEPRGTECDQDGGNACDGEGACVQCIDDSFCTDDFNQCTTVPACVDDRCTPTTNLPEGSVCNQDGGNRCDGNGTCVFVSGGPDPQTRDITLGCKTNVSPEVSIVPFELTVAPSVIVAGGAFTADLSGFGLIAEELLDAVQVTVVGGATRADLIGLKATVHVRDGAIGTDVPLTSVPIPQVCALDGAPCDPANDLPSVPGKRGNSGCVPVGPTNPCGRFVDLPTSDDCGPGGLCDTIDGGTGVKLGQCSTNGFCVTGGLALPLQSQVASYTATSADNVLFGWDDMSTGATLNPDGTWNLPPAVFVDPIDSTGIRVDIQGLSVGLECTMGVDSGSIFGVGVPGESSPTPTQLLISFPIIAP